MKKCNLILVLLVLIATSATAQYAYIPDSNAGAGSNNIWPFNMSSTTGRFIQILDAKYLPNGPVKITEVAFTRHTQYSRGITSFFAKQFQMRMSHSTSVCVGSLSKPFADHMAPCPTNLINTTSGFTYSLPTGETWVDIGTNCDFGYDGKRHICLEVRFRGQNVALGFVGWADGGGTPRLMSKLTPIDNYAALVGSSSWCTNGLKVRLTYVKNCVLLAADAAPIGSTEGIAVVNMPLGDMYQIAASLGQAPMKVGPCHVCLVLDGVFLTSILIGPPVFVNYAGQIPVGGRATGRFVIPQFPAIIGLCVYHAAVAYSAKGVTCCTNTAGTLLTK